MDVTNIIATFEQSPRKFPQTAINEAIRQKDQIVPELLALIENPEDLFQKCERQPDYMGHVYAMFLLAQFRIPRAIPLVIKIYSYPREQVDLLGWDLVTEDLPRIVASVFAGDPSPIKALIENEDADEYVRDAMLKTLMILVLHGKMAREELTAYCTFLIREKLDRTPSFIWCGVAKTCAELAEQRLLEELKVIFAEDLADPSYMTLDEVEELMMRGWSQNFTKITTESDYHLVEDVVGEMEWWAFFQEPDQQEISPAFSESAKIPRMPSQTSHRSRQKSNHKPGRNHTCPCGSGKKYKNCCGKRRPRAG